MERKFTLFSPVCRFIQGDSLLDLDKGQYSLLELLDGSDQDIWFHIQNPSPAEEELILSVS